MCEACQSYFPDQAELILHRNLSHADLKKPPGNEDCPFCSRNFETSSQMQEHANAEHKVNAGLSLKAILLLYWLATDCY